MFDLKFSESILYKTHKIRLERNPSEIIQIEVHEALQLGDSSSKPKFFARIIDALGFPSKKFIASGNSLEEAVNGILPEAESLPMDVLCPPLKSAAHLAQ
ncbi:hypothetical protein [Microbulbifer sp. 2205BS26-8]|uniref:hypothetical protein n=1 Tax=Microbulbifer sp. 2205BS26-8 TaxID=3064386 RepID=UPI00273F0D85|nr:hypothetical protein [Microbulbifer sp. 2205BS26-8]MDP5210974.1 hypothetical protein [Microbulbifer sp. 2205BS26-8]